MSNLTKEIVEKIMEEAENHCQCGMDNCSRKNDYTLGATKWAEELISIIEWACENGLYSRTTKLWYMQGVIEPLTTSDLLIMYIKNKK